MTNSSNRARQLFTLGEDWRTERPGLWAILRGRGSDVRIAQLLGWPIHRVQAEMDSLEALGIAHQNTEGTWFLNKDHDLYEEYVAVRKFYQAIDRKLVDQFPTRIQLMELSSIVREEARAAQKTAKAKDPQPTEAQLKILTAAYQAFGRAQFTPLALGKAQGYTQAGWSKKYLDTLGRRGFAEQVAHKGRGSLWQLTEIGVEWATK